MKTAVIHIGTHKTGSTTIQDFLRVNRSKLQGRKIAAVRLDGKPNLSQLHLYASPKSRHTNLLRMRAWRDDAKYQAFADSFPEELGQVVDGFKGCNTYIFSAESLGLLRSDEDIRRLQSLFAPHFDDIRILVYLRRQDDLAISLYQQHLKGGSTSERVIPAGALGIYNFKSMLQAYEGVFGREKIAARRFDTGSGRFDIVDDFLSTIGIKNRGFAPIKRRNESVGVQGAAILLEFNRLVSDGGLNQDPSPFRKRTLVPLLRTIKSDSKLKLSAQESAEFMARYADQNRWVSAHYFGGQKLFP